MRLAERTQGIPLLLVELVRGLKRDGIVRKSEKTGAWILATDELDKLPDLPLVQWLASRETESLPPDLLAHARLASMFGVEFGAEELEGVMLELERVGAAPETQLDASIGLRRLAESGLLVRHRGGRVGFRHALLRDSVYQSGRRPLSARRSTAPPTITSSARYAQPPDAARLPAAWRSTRRAAGLKEEAGRLFLDLAKRLIARHAYLDAETLFRNALENLPDDRRSTRCDRRRPAGRALMRFRLGRHEDALKDFRTRRPTGRARREARGIAGDRSAPRSGRRPRRAEPADASRSADISKRGASSSPRTSRVPAPTIDASAPSRRSAARPTAPTTWPRPAST